MVDTDPTIPMSVNPEERHLIRPVLFEPVVFEKRLKPAKEDFIPTFCRQELEVDVSTASSDTSVVDVTAPPVPAREQKQVRSSQEGDLSASVSPEKTLALLRGMMAQAPSEEPPKRERKRSTP